MFKNYLTIIWRNIIRQPVFTILNLSSLTIGIAAALVILLYLDFEINYDRFHEKADRIYRIETNSILTHDKTMDVDWPRTPWLLGPYMKQDYPDVESFTRFYRFFQNDVIELKVDDKVITEEFAFVADSSALDMFTFDFISGDRNTAFDGPDKIIISETLSKRMFGEDNPVGRIVKTSLLHILPEAESDYTFMISGVFRDLPENSLFTFNLLISSASDPKIQDYYFKIFNFYTYVLLKEGTDSKALAPNLSKIYKKYLNPEIEPILKSANHELVPLTEIHMEETGGATYLYIFSAIGFLILLIATISYVNLVTAQASKRALEIGVRKVMGSSRQQLIVQFLSESLFFTIFALLLALTLVYLMMVPINEMLHLQLNAHELFRPRLIFGIFAILIAVGLIGGSYPAFFLSSFQPITVLKGKLVKGTQLRRMLVWVQFAVVIFVLVSTGMIYDQLRFLRQKDLGFDYDQVVRIGIDSEEKMQKISLFKEALKQSPLIKKVGSASFLPGVGMPRRPLSADNAPSRESQFVHFGRIDYDYLETMNIKLTAGRNFSETFQSDATQNIIVNEALIKNFGLKNPIGEKMRYGDKNNPNFVRIVGVIEDFHQSSLHTEIASQIFLLEPNTPNLSIKIDQNILGGIDHIEKSWHQIFPNEAFEYHFFEEDLAASYETDQIRGKIFLLLSGITIFIAFLGLFGLASYIARQRKKEIGIRKVLGASIWNVIVLISKDFLLLVVLAAIPGFVAAWYFIHQWLEDFAYRTDMNYLLFGLVLLLTMTFTFITTGLQAARVSQLNPAETLKYG